MFLRSDADFNGGSVRHLAHAIVTCIGTAGLEYATRGIPPVLGGESAYSGFGFTIEPGNLREYEECLRGIAGLPRLSTEQIRAAKLVAFFYFCVMESARYYFCPYFSDREVSEWNALRDNRFWKEVADQFRDAEHVQKMRGQVEELSRFVRDPGWRQYVDLRQFPFLQDGVSAAGVVDLAPNVASNRG